ncbi:MAG: CvpA family protein [Muribaculaceae bacterium]|nr:CvpA family protein [Muribaculaceae bacterium]
MQTIDYIILGLIAWAAIYGWTKGLVKQAAQFAGVIVGIILCRLAVNPLAQILPGQGDTNKVLAYVIAFLIGYAGMLLLGTAIRKLVRTLKLGVVDNLGGALFSICEWLIGVSLLLNLWQLVAPHSAPVHDGLSEFVYRFGPAVCAGLNL